MIKCVRRLKIATVGQQKMRESTNRYKLSKNFIDEWLGQCIKQESVNIASALSSTINDWIDSESPCFEKTTSPVTTATTPDPSTMPSTAGSLFNLIILYSQLTFLIFCNVLLLFVIIGFKKILNIEILQRPVQNAPNNISLQFRPSAPLLDILPPATTQTRPNEYLLS